MNEPNQRKNPTHAQKNGNENMEKNVFTLKKYSHFEMINKMEN